MDVMSEAFADGEPIPDRFTCEGENVSPALSWSDPPEGTATLALVVDDPDAPGGVSVHWVAWNIPADAGGLPEGVRADDEPPTQGARTSGSRGYAGPCPPPIHGAHDYRFRLFASDIELELPKSTTQEELYRALDNHVLAMGELIGTYNR
ncbi:MAG: YbhB/YbcL family Raf kinase inhibitor-like protein [Myxococcales bacterium]|nr:YbhB/YbcL family Raf kinase inhibitor-like protein [Myxococcales bacterium]MCB9752921.1 YbhB/YbcL family Raf kinase inhibitor-like protein [Myxococcales bacterium]